MNEQNSNPCDPLVEAIADAVIKRIGASNGSKEAEDRLLTAEEASLLLSMSTDWLYRNAKKLPFTRKLGPNTLRFSHQGILKWLATRKLS